MKIALQWQKLLLPNTNSGKAAIFWAAVFSGIWLLLQGLCGLFLGYRISDVSTAPCALALLGIFVREVLRALLSTLPKGRRFWAGLGIGSCVRTGRVPPACGYNFHCGASVARIPPHLLPLCLADSAGHTRWSPAGASLRSYSPSCRTLDPHLPGAEPANGSAAGAGAEYDVSCGSGLRPQSR